MTANDLKRLIDNLCRVGTISEVYSNQEPNRFEKDAMYARVNIDGRVTDWFPVFAQTGFGNKYTPVRLQEQVMVFCPFGNANYGVILRGIFPKGMQPIKNPKTERIEYEDGTVFEIDLEAKKIIIETENEIFLSTGKVELKSSDALSIECKEATVKSGKVTLDSGNINLGIGGLGVITEKSICPFTESPHTDGSKTTMST